jgi:hypothetical protein
MIVSGFIAWPLITPSSIAAWLSRGYDCFRIYCLAVDYSIFDSRSAWSPRGLAYLPILAEFTLKVAAHRSDRKAFRAGLEMEKGLFFDWVWIC